MKLYDWQIFEKKKKNLRVYLILQRVLILRGKIRDGIPKLTNVFLRAYKDITESGVTPERVQKHSFYLKSNNSELKLDEGEK